MACGRANFDKLVVYVLVYTRISFTEGFLMNSVQITSSNKTSGFFWGIVAFMASKGVVILKALKVLKYAKFAITAITMSLSAILYGFAFGSWYFAVGFVLLLLVHEYGHVIAMWRKGVHASVPVFIPFLGAAIFAEIPKKKEDEAYIGYGGPVLGTIGALVCIIVAFALQQGSFQSTLLHILGNVGLFINLFNLIPARPLDGGRILHPLGNGVVYCGFTMLLALALATGDLFFVFIALLSVDNMPIRKWIELMLWGLLLAAFGVELGLSLHGLLHQIFFYVFIAISICLFIFAWKEREVPLPVFLAQDESGTVPVLVKIKWLMLYLGLLAVLVGTMTWHSRHLPKEINESTLVQFVHKL